MPIQRCIHDGKSGYRWGNQGKCYTGKDARRKAVEQGRAIEANKSKATPKYTILEAVDKIISKKKT